MTTELALANELQPKLNRAKAIYIEMHSAELSLRGARDRILTLAHQLGGTLCELKEIVNAKSSGNWLLWLPSNFRELGINEERVIRNAERCMKLFMSNPDSRNSANFTIDSVRKFMWGYIPVKERPQLEDDEPDPPGVHHLTFVNQFSKWDRQLRSGHIDGFDIEIFRRELEPMVRRIADLGGTDWLLRVLT